MATLSTVSLSIGYREPLFSNLNLTLEEGKLTSLLGLNGAGKSTLLRTLCALQQPRSGTVQVDGKQLGDYSRAQLATLIGMVLTEKSAAGGLTVYELVSLGRHPHTDFLGRLKESDHKVILHSMESAGIADKASRHLSDLSDGERQKAFIAKALAQECPIIILDEPTAFLDITSRIETMDMLHHLATQDGKTILLSTHDLDTALRFSDSLWIADSASGEIITGSCSTLANPELFGRIFGSKVAEMIDYRQPACSSSKGE